MNSTARLFRVSEFRNAFLFRGLLVWAALRLALAVSPFTPSGGEGLVATLFVRVGPAEALFIAAAAGAAVWLDALRRGEAAFLANLGIAGPSVGLLGALPAAVIELIL